MEGRVRSLLLPAVVVFFFLAPAVTVFCQVGSGQDKPGYDFITFDTTYDRLVDRARAEGYQVQEEEIVSAYGARHLILDRSGRFYREEASLFFNQDRQLIFFSIRFTLLENQPRTIVRKLINSMQQKLEQKYGPSERDTVPYFKVYENAYEIFVYPPAPASENARISFKHLDRFSSYLEYYRQEVEKLVNQEIEETVQNL